MPILWPTNVFYKVPQLFTERSENFVFVFHGVWSTISLIRHCARCPYLPSRKGMSSSLVRSGPRASAMVESR